MHLTFDIFYNKFVVFFSVAYSLITNTFMFALSSFMTLKLSGKLSINGFSPQAQQRLEESSHKLDLIRLSLERLRGDLPHGSIMAGEVS